MISRSHISALLVILFITACRKEDALFDADADPIIVDVLWKNDVNGTGLDEPIPKDQEVFISSGSNTAEYLFKRKTDSNGRCYFENLPSGEYTVWATRTISGTNDQPALIFKQSDTGSSRTRTLLLVPGSAQTGFVLSCENSSGEPMVGLKVCTQATAAAAAAGCGSPLFTEQITDAQGRVARWGIGMGTYYVRISSATGMLLRLDTVTVTAGMLEYNTATIVLPTITGVELHCQDENGVGVAGLTIHGYTTQALANTGIPTLAAYEVTAVGNGVYRKEGINPQPYWLRIVSTAQSIDQIQPITVAPDPIEPTTVLIAPTPPTGYQVFCHDGSNNGIPGLTINGYTTQTLADSLFTQLASFQLPAVDAFGTYRVTGVPPGNYWLGISNTQLGIDTFRPITVTANTVLMDAFDVIP